MRLRVRVCLSTCLVSASIDQGQSWGRETFEEGGSQVGALARLRGWRHHKIYHIALPRAARRIPSQVSLACICSHASGLIALWLVGDTWLVGDECGAEQWLLAHLLLGCEAELRCIARGRLLLEQHGARQGGIPTCLRLASLAYGTLQTPADSQRRKRREGGRRSCATWRLQATRRALAPKKTRKLNKTRAGKGSKTSGRAKMPCWRKAATTGLDACRKPPAPTVHHTAAATALSPSPARCRPTPTQSCAEQRWVPQAQAQLAADAEASVAAEGRGRCGCRHAACSWCSEEQGAEQASHGRRKARGSIRKRKACSCRNRCGRRAASRLHAPWTGSRPRCP